MCTVLMLSFKNKTHQKWILEALDKKNATKKFLQNLITKLQIYDAYFYNKATKTNLVRLLMWIAYVSQVNEGDATWLIPHITKARINSWNDDPYVLGKHFATNLLENSDYDSDTEADTDFETEADTDFETETDTEVEADSDEEISSVSHKKINKKTVSKLPPPNKIPGGKNKVNCTKAKNTKEVKPKVSNTNGFNTKSMKKKDSDTRILDLKSSNTLVPKSTNHIPKTDNLLNSNTHSLNSNTPRYNSLSSNTSCSNTPHCDIPVITDEQVEMVLGKKKLSDNAKKYLDEIVLEIVTCIGNNFNIIHSLAQNNPGNSLLQHLANYKANIKYELFIIHTLRYLLLQQANRLCAEKIREKNMKNICIGDGEISMTLNLIRLACKSCH